jgi:hypothetical protein
MFWVTSCSSSGEPIVSIQHLVYVTGIQTDEFFIGNEEKFQTNSSVHNIDTRNKHHLHRPVANLSCFQKGASYCGIGIFNSLPRSITSLKNEKTQFIVALKKFLNAHCFYCVDEFFTCTDDMYCWLYDCVNVSYSVILLLSVGLWHVPHPIVLWLSGICGMYICMYVTLCQWPFRVQVSELRTKRSPTQSDIYQMLYWYNWFSWWWARGCSKHVENWNKYTEKNCASSWSFTMNVN